MADKGRPFTRQEATQLLVDIGNGYHAAAMALGTLLAGEDQTNNVLRVENQFTHLGRVTADGQIKAGAGFVHLINVNPTTATPTAGLLTIYDSLTESGTILHSEWVFAAGIAHTIWLNRAFSTGLYVGFDATLANISVDVTGR